MDDPATAPGARALVVMPTYDEAENLERVAGAVLAAVPDVDLLVVDDDSPDGTGDIADRMAAADPRVTVLHRTSRDGLGRAYLAGFAEADRRGYPVVVEMDADGSHPVESLAALLDAVAEPGGPGLAIGSRWVPGGRVVDWAPWRGWLSRAGNTYARLALGIPVRDATAGYRAYRLEAIRAAHLDDVHSRGYCFQIDMALRVLDAGIEVVEVPITFRDRIAGTSKMSGAIVAEAMLRVTGWALARRLGRRRRT
ncbi:polyprenol monophosphomannose synthase [Schumannella luteola]|uniref:Dolichol-phosphate mannosyltransferase n=1 Tax=Schumannella luteola TaxID=472059 RepID=A0A852YHZ5_9MICO|nr:polyprenol monophosphomannose synthase [Schumannella luteola]NYG98708.1 dolichol-phosphate mannosyltransferase [Schumannella luteola]TPX04293.1 polyprenol monophosphomannose synthase [Schumannella luteola]